MIKISRNCLLLISGLLLWNAASQRAFAQEWKTWHYYADVSVQPQADPSYDAVYADFSRLLDHDLHQKGALDENSIRVAPLEEGKAGEALPMRFVKDTGFDATDNAAGTIVFQVAATPKAGEAQYRVFFDTKANGPKPAVKEDPDVPEKANMIWNGSFEILSADYKGMNIYANTGTNIPRGWWGNLLNGGILTNLATSAHSGKNALGFVVPADKTNTGVISAPTPPGIRALPGQGYQLSFWVKGENLTSRYVAYESVYWYDKDGKYLSNVGIGNLPKTASFDWTQGQINVITPADANYFTINVGTYSKTGVLTVDDFEARGAIAPPLANAKINQ